jgi:hypothetical protein
LQKETTDCEYDFKLAGPLQVAPVILTRLSLIATTGDIGIQVCEQALVFDSAGWFEVLLTVEWDSANRQGRRFAHTAIPDSHPLHSEAIEADVLADLSDGRQLLRGNTFFDPSSSVRSLALEVWQDSPDPVTIKNASLTIRPLPNP